MVKNIFKIVVIFIIGMAGGIFADQILWSYLGERPPSFYESQLAAMPAVIEKNEITIQENTALQNAVEKVEKVVVGIRTKLKSGKVLEGSGVIITSDGLMVTLDELLPQGEIFAFFVDGKTPKYQVLKRDLEINLALVKIEEENLATISFADFSKLRLGERVFLVGMISEKAGWQKIVNEGIVKFFSQDEENNYIQTNISEKNILNGSSLFNIKGELLGLNTINSEGKVFAIPITKIRHFIGY